MTYDPITRTISIDKNQLAAGAWQATYGLEAKLVDSGGAINKYQFKVHVEGPENGIEGVPVAELVNATEEI